MFLVELVLIAGNDVFGLLRVDLGQPQLFLFEGGVVVFVALENRVETLSVVKAHQMLVFLWVERGGRVLKSLNFLL